MFVCTASQPTTVFRRLFVGTQESKQHTERKLLCISRLKESRIILLNVQRSFFSSYSPISLRKWWLMNLYTRQHVQAMTTTAFEEHKKQKQNKKEENKM